MNIEIAVHRFLQYQLNRRRMAPTSARLYGSYLRRFAAHAGPRAPLGRAARRADAYIESLGDLSDHAQFSAFAITRRFFRWACENGHARRNPLADAPPPIKRQRPKVFLTKGEVNRVFEAVRRVNLATKERDLALIACLYYAGLRASEPGRLMIEDVNLRAGTLRVQGKGGRVDELPLHRALAAILMRYLRQHHGGGRFVFPSRKGGALSGLAVSDRFRKYYAKASGLHVRVTPHTLRRSFANRLRRRRVDLEKVQRLLRHKRITTTMEYLEGASAEELAREIGKA